MWTSGIVIFLGVFWATGNIIASMGFALGYYVIVGALSLVLGKIGVKILPRVVMQLLIAVGVLVFACVGMGRGDGKNEGTSDEGHGTLVADEGKKSQLDGETNLDKDEKVRDFALKEAPLLWKTYQYLTEAVGDQDKRIAELRKTLEMFGGNADKDADLRKLAQTRNELVRSRNIIRAKLDEAYLQSRKFAAAPNRKEFEQQKDKSVNEGLAEAKRTLTRIKEMKQPK